MARSPVGAEPTEDVLLHKPSLPPFSKFLYDTGHSNLFAQSQHRQVPGNAEPSSTVPLGNRLSRPNGFRPPDPHPLTSTKTLSRPQTVQSDTNNRHHWSYPDAISLCNNPVFPDPLMTGASVVHVPGRAVLREVIIPGKGLCHIYDDRTICQKVVNGDPVNSKWGTTKAGKPRKRLGQACNTCREKKSKCDPGVPKCVQCQKFGRECKFGIAARSVPRQSGSTPSISQATIANRTQQEHKSRRGSIASIDLVPPEHPFSGAVLRPSMLPKTAVSPASGDENNQDEGSDSRPPAKKPRVSLSQPVPEGWPSETAGTESLAGSIPSLSAMSTFSWEVDPYHVDRDMTLYYTGKYFNHVGGPAYSTLPRKAFTRWVKESTTKASIDKMLLYAILAMGTVFARRAESKHHRDVFIDIVNKAVMKNGDTFSLQLIQTKLILALLAFSQGQYNQAWDLSGSAMRVAFGLKFHTEEGVSVIGDRDRLDLDLDHATLVECRRRTFWLAYTIDCFNGCCSASVTAVNRSDCRLRLPCEQAAYKWGQIPLTPFNLDPSTNNREHQTAVRQEISEVGVLGFLAEVATILNEVVSRITGSKSQTVPKDHKSMEMFHQSIMGQLNVWDTLTKRYSQQPVSGLRILYHYTAMILHRYVRHSDIDQLPLCVYVRGAYDHARLMLEMVQRLINHEEKDGQLFLFATFSPFSGFAITSALDIITAAGTMADLMGDKNQMMSLITSGLEVLEDSVDFWHSARRQRDMVKQRFGALLKATNRASDFNGAFYFRQPMQSPVGLDQDIIYGLPRPRYFEALGWGDRIHHDGDFHRLD